MLTMIINCHLCREEFGMKQISIIAGGSVTAKELYIQTMD